MSSSDEQLLKLLDELSKAKATNKLFDWKPIPKQWDFLNCKAKRKALVASNQCLSGDTVLEDAKTGRKCRVDEIGDDFHLWSWDGSKRVACKIAKPAKKCGLHDVVDVKCGEASLSVTMDHQLLGKDGWVHACDFASQSQVELVRLQTIEERDRLIRVSDALRLMRIALDSRFYCLPYHHSCDEQLHYLREAFQSLQTSQTYALAHNVRCSCEPSDDLRYTEERSHQHQSHDRHSIHDACRHGEARGAWELSHVRLAVSLHVQDLQDALWRLSLLTSQNECLQESHQQEVGDSRVFYETGPNECCSSCNEPGQHELGFLDEMLLQLERCARLINIDEATLCQLDTLLQRIHSLVPCITSNQIVAQIGSMRKSEVYEIHSERYGNFFVGELLNHNCGKSKTLLYEITLHLTGLYPDEWKGIRSNRPVDIWLVGETADRVRDTLQQTLFGDEGQYGTGMIPSSCLNLNKGTGIVMKQGVSGAIHRAKVKHVSGGWASIQFFSYDQKRESFQGSTIDIVGFDEEPPEDIHGECVIRIAVKDGYMLYSFTPLKGQTNVWQSIVQDPSAKCFSIAMDDCPWMSPDKIDRLLNHSGYSEMEKRARRYGIPAVGEGQIFMFEEKDYTCESFKIPDHWPRLGGLDIGKNHPTGAVAIAWDRDSGCVYCYQEFKQRESNAADLARRLKHWQVEFATSHDAFNETFARGESAAQILESEGLRIFSAGRDNWGRIEKVRNMIGNGRFWVFKDRCPCLLDEMRIFSSKRGANGKEAIVKINDDVVDAMTHAVAFFEKAKVKGMDDTYTEPLAQWKPADSRWGY